MMSGDTLARQGNMRQNEDVHCKGASWLQHAVHLLEALGAVWGVAGGLNGVGMVKLAILERWVHKVALVGSQATKEEHKTSGTE